MLHIGTYRFVEQFGAGPRELHRVPKIRDGAQRDSKCDEGHKGIRWLAQSRAMLLGPFHDALEPQRQGRNRFEPRILPSHGEFYFFRTSGQRNPLDNGKYPNAKEAGSWSMTSVALLHTYTKPSGLR